jgi:hypothetical protein
MEIKDGVSRVPTLDLSDRELSRPEKIADIRRNKLFIPTSVKELLSDNSSARECFVLRKNSRKMQELMISYAYTIMTTKVMRGDV